MMKKVDRDDDHVRATEVPAVKRGSRALGRIDRAQKGMIEGWMISADVNSVPIVTVNGRAARPINLQVPRPDVSKKLQVDGSYGYQYSVSGVSAGDQVKLWSLDSLGLVEVSQSVVSEDKVEIHFLNQLHRAKNILRNASDAVAVVCWDGAHNPIGRAKVLYDIIATRRPAVLFTYVFEEFGGSLWKPLQSLDLTIVTIPWEDRERYHRTIRQAGLTFDTVWICKPRLPSFLLARLVSHEDTKLILDRDDNEDHFSRSSASREKSYGIASINLAREIAGRISSQTAASLPLCKDFEAIMVRHARGMPPPSSADMLTDAPRKNLGFIGTVRPHKGILSAARAVKMYNWRCKGDVEFHVYGDIRPSSLVNELEGGGVVVKQDIPASKLTEALGELDVVITGYPSQDEEVNKYQISSKIGDALMMGKPVMVPRAAATRDLHDVDGVYLFDEDTFGNQLEAALKHSGRPGLPVDFTLEGAYKAFAEAESIAESADRAGTALRILPIFGESSCDLQPALVLMWKQHDAGLYGRRVDQIARAYKRRFPERKVIILEMLHESTLRAYRDHVKNYFSERAKIVNISEAKVAGNFNDDGVEVHQLLYSSSDKLPNLVEKFFVDHGLMPFNTVIIQFPIIRFVESLGCVLRSYPKIVDVVDNQFSWASTAGKSSIGLQYAMIFSDASAIVFNSEQNCGFFRTSGFIADSKAVRVLPNWYTARSEFKGAKRQWSSGRSVLYSGNMNDRIDWSLLRRIATDPAGFTLHIAGTATGNAALISLLENENVIYHGPLSEAEVYRLLLTEIDAGIVPHVRDGVSTYMNPLKVHMYACAGVPVITTEVPGIDAMAGVSIAQNSEEFLTMLKTGCSASTDVQYAENSSTAYIDLIESLRPASGYSDLEKRKGVVWRAVAERV